MDNKKKWYDSAYIINDLIIGIILLIIVFTQSFALGRNGSIELFTSIINHNSVYLFILIYFVLLKFYIGKRYFNYLSVILIFVYFITTTTSFLTLIQAFSLNSTLDFVLNSLILIYLVHTLLRDTRIWREFYLSKSPFNELPNDFMFYSIIVIAIILLAVNLISTVALSGVVITILDTIYIVLLDRYIYLYRTYLDKKKKEVGDNMNFDEIKKTLKDIDKDVSKTVDDIGKNINDYVVEKGIDKKVEKAVEATKEAGKEIGKNMKKAAKDVGDSLKGTKKGDK